MPKPAYVAAEPRGARPSHPPSHVSPLAATLPTTALRPMRPAVYAAILGAGVGIGVLVLVLRRRSSGGPKGSTLGRSATSMLARRPSQPSAGGEARQYRAFVSHMKAEAAMEARFVQSEIETISGRCCFLDSDDLKDLSQLTKHVRDSEVLVLVQTKSVLTRPWVLIELVTAVRAGIPIVGVSLDGRKDAEYSHDAARDLLLNLDERLESLTPGAAAALREQAVDPREAAWLLSSTLPQIISVALNVCASRRLLAATIDDLVDALDQAKPPAPVPATEAEWVEKREITRLEEAALAKRFKAGVAKSKDGGGGGARLATGASLLESIKAHVGDPSRRRSLQSVAYLLQAVHSAAAQAVHLKDDCEQFGLVAATLEQRLVGAAGGGALAAAPLDAIGRLADALEEAIALLRLFATAELDAADLAAHYRRGALPSLAEKLESSGVELGGRRAGAPPLDASGQSGDFEQSKRLDTRLADGFVERDLDKLPLSSADIGTADASSAGAVALPTVRVGAQVAAVDALRAEMATAQAVASDATAQQQAVLEMQNKVLLDQVAQMQSMMAKQQMLMSQYMTKWPTPLDEAERVLTVERSELMSMMPGSKPLAPVDAVVRELCASPLCADVYGVFVNIIDASFQKAISYSLRTPSQWMLPLDVSENVRGHIGIPRKLSSCQYVVATGQMFCHARSERDPFRQKDAEDLRDALADGSTEREKFDEILSNDGFYKALEDTSVTGDDQPVFDVFKSLFSGEYTYLGAPVRYGGRVMGALCTMGTRPKATAEERAELERYADRVSALLEKIIV